MVKKESKKDCVCKQKDAKIDELTTDLKRLQADFENYQKRTENEFISRDERARASIMLQSLTVLDTINEAIKHEEKNEALVRVKEVLIKFLHSTGVVKMTKKAGSQFDHEEMECLMQESVENKDDNEVLEVLQKGYFINDKILRFAKVKVNKISKKTEEK
jgi:molecular chaperone GrpE